MGHTSCYMRLLAVNCPPTLQRDGNSAEVDQSDFQHQNSEIANTQFPLHVCITTMLSHSLSADTTHCITTPHLLSGVDIGRTPSHCHVVIDRGQTSREKESVRTIFMVFLLVLHTAVARYILEADVSRFHETNINK